MDKETLELREAELVKIIESAKKIEVSTEWRSLKKYVFDGLVQKLERELLNEAKKESPDVLSLARTNGQLIWAKRYSDLNKLAEVFKLELNGIRKLK